MNASVLIGTGLGAVALVLAAVITTFVQHRRRT